MWMYMANIYRYAEASNAEAASWISEYMDNYEWCIRELSVLSH